MRPDKPHTTALFNAEMIDLKREIMTWGVLLPLMVLGYIGIFVSYQRPFIETLDIGVPALFALAFGVGLAGALANRVHPRLALGVAGWGALGVALLFSLRGLDGYTAIGVGFACGVVTLLLGQAWGWGALGVAAVVLAGFAALPAGRVFAGLDPAAGLWPSRVLVALVAAAFSVILAARVTRVLFRALKWMQENYELARSQTDALSEKSAQLELALKSLGQTSFQLARANEQMEVAMQYAEEARQSKQQFAAAVSHELRAPLNLIIGFSDLILNGPSAYADGAAGLPPKLMADMHVINNHAQHLRKLVNDILDLSQLDANYLTIARAPVRIAELIQAAVDDYAYLVAQRGLALRVDIDAGLPVIMADPVRIRQILLNLLSNALRFTERGSITVQARLSRADEERTRSVSPSSLVISVADTGSGITPADLRRIFEPFVQVGDFSQRRGEGSGLGLTISKRFVELHGGRMWVESAPGAGSTFLFSLPADAPAPQSAAASPERLPHEFKRHEVGTLAVVERTAVLSRLIERQIEGMRIVSAPSVAALCADGECNHEVVLINEPVTTAPALPDKLKHVPVMRCYVHGVMPLNVLGADSPAAAEQRHKYLIKPVKREQLYTALAQMVAPAGEDAPVRALRVLIVEDEDDASYLLARMLRLMPADLLQGYAGVTVTQARSGEQALEILEQADAPGAPPIDAVLLDLVLGTVSGYTVLAKMESTPGLADIPVCVITGQVAGGDVLVTPHLVFSRQNGLSARELAEAVVALTRIALPGVEVSVR